MTRVLIVDDDPKFRSYVARGLTAQGLEALTAADADEALRLLERAGPGPDVALLDVMMDGLSGWQLLEHMRARGHELPVIFVTAKHAVDDRVRGLRLGADDYILKPFEFQELLARIEAVLRRRRSLPVLEVDDLRIDLARRTVERDGRRLDLSPKEFDLLLALAESQGRVLSRAELLRRVWAIDFDPQTNVVDTAVARLRKRLERGPQPLIQTVVGQGYRLAPRGDGC
jgi:two-component system copper resistance phosphate regulon response regulator CusR